MRAQYDGTCAKCVKPIKAGQSIMRMDNSKSYRHVDCDNPDAEVQLKEPNAPANDKQRGLIKKLSYQRVVPEGLELPAEEDALTMQQASDIIDQLLAAPEASKTPLPSADVIPAGRYAVVLELRGEKHDFLVRVWRGDRNPNYVRCYNDDTGEEVDRHDAMRRILAADPFEAAKRYGQLRARCSRCGIKLRNKLSVELSIGPECIKYWIRSEAKIALMKDKARAAIRARGEDPNATIVGYREPEQMHMEVQS